MKPFLSTTFFDDLYPSYMPSLTPFLTVIATSIWSEIISNMSESFLKDPYTANFGEALRNSDYSKVQTLRQDLENPWILKPMDLS